MMTASCKVQSPALVLGQDELPSWQHPLVKSRSLIRLYDEGGLLCDSGALAVKERRSGA